MLSQNGTAPTDSTSLKQTISYMWEKLENLTHPDMDCQIEKSTFITEPWMHKILHCLINFL